MAKSISCSSTNIDCLEARSFNLCSSRSKLLCCTSLRCKQVHIKQSIFCRKFCILCTVESCNRNIQSIHCVSRLRRATQRRICNLVNREKYITSINTKLCIVTLRNGDTTYNSVNYKIIKIKSHNIFLLKKIKILFFVICVIKEHICSSINLRNKFYLVFT